MNPLEEYRDRVRALLAQTTLSAREIDRRTAGAVSYTQVRRIASGAIRTPNWDQLSAICRALGVEPSARIEHLVADAAPAYGDPSLADLRRVAAACGHVKALTAFVRRLNTLTPEQRLVMLRFLTGDPPT